MNMLGPIKTRRGPVGCEYVNYTTRLNDVPTGATFVMLNYVGLFMRLEEHPKNCPSDTYHVPIVDLANGSVFRMAREKPCRLCGLFEIGEQVHELDSVGWE